uniref:Jacalin-type lectin domain-containing protein n=1 Tax=Amphimedon queenslandica TaxID=400682 RepID=A0A1X7V4E0_AMPQE
MKIFLTIIVCLQLLQQKEGASLSEETEWTEEPLIYDTVDLQAEEELTPQYSNELKDTVDLPPGPTEDTKNEWKELSDEDILNAATTDTTKIDIPVFKNEGEELKKETISDDVSLDAVLEQALPAGHDKKINEVNTANAENNQLRDEISFADIRDEKDQGADVQEEPKVTITEIYNTKTSKPLNDVLAQSGANCKQYFSDVSTEQYSYNIRVGGSGGNDYTINKNGENQGRIVQSLTFWLERYGHHISMETKLSDGTKVSCGSEKSSSRKTFIFKPDEKITGLTIYTDKKDCSGYISGIYFSTNKHRYFNFRGGGNSNYYYHPQPLGSGILVGFRARCGRMMDAITFLFMQNVERSTLTHVQYPHINSLSILEKPFHINEMKCDNKGRKVEQEFTLSGSRSVNEIHQWSPSSTRLETRLTNTRVESSIASITLPTGNSLTSNLVMSSPYYHDRELNINSTQNYAFNIKVPPGKEVIATATAYQGVIETPYTGRLTVTLITGRTFNYHVTGVYRSKTTSNVVVSTKDVI